MIVALRLQNGTINCISNPTNDDVVVHDYDIQDTNNLNFEYGQDRDGKDYIILRFSPDPYGISAESRHDCKSEKVKLHPDKAERQDCADCLYPERSCSQCINKVKELKPLAQYLDEYLGKYLNGETLPQDLLEQALDAYESTEQVEIKIEKI